MTDFQFLGIDLQKEFTHPQGKAYRLRPCVDFVRTVLLPHMRKHGLKTAEINSDYRQPRPGSGSDQCHPGTEMFESEIPDELRQGRIWYKSMHNPIWIRENIALPDRTPGLPYQDPLGFNRWLCETLGVSRLTVVLYGLTLDCCILCAAQELYWRGHRVCVLVEATDAYSGDKEEKQRLLSGPPLTNWARPIEWEALINGPLG